MRSTGCTLHLKSRTIKSALPTTKVRTGEEAKVDRAMKMTLKANGKRKMVQLASMGGSVDQTSKRIWPHIKINKILKKNKTDIQTSGYRTFEPI